MSLVFNMVGGGSGGGGGPSASDAILTVTVPTGSTVTAVKGGVTLTPTMWVKAADASLDCAIFSVPASKFDSTTPWTVTATLGKQTASETVLVTANKEYEVELSYLVPAEYQAVEYLERQVQSGAYFNTGIVPLRTDFVEVRFKMLSWANYPWVIGLQMGSSSYWGATYDPGGQINIYYNTNQYVRIASGYTNTDNVIQWENANTIRVSNDDGATFTDYSKTQSNNPQNPFLIFAVGSGLVGKGENNMRVKRVTIADAEFIPCYRKSDSVPGFWNKRDDIFITKTGTDSILVGPDL